MRATAIVHFFLKKFAKTQLSNTSSLLRGSMVLHSLLVILEVCLARRIFTGEQDHQLDGHFISTQSADP